MTTGHDFVDLATSTIDKQPVSMGEICGWTGFRVVKRWIVVRRKKWNGYTKVRERSYKSEYTSKAALISLAEDNSNRV